MAALRQIICDLKDTFQSADKSRGESCGFGTRDGPAALRRTTGTLVAWTSRNMAAATIFELAGRHRFRKAAGTQ